MKSILEYLEQTAAVLGEKTAFADVNTQITFAGLQEEAEKAGSDLAKRVKARRPVPILMEKSVRTIQLMLGAAYAGCYYIMLDATQPAERVSQILATLEPDILLVSREHMEYARGLKTNAELIPEETLGTGPADEALLEERREGQKDTDPLYVLFTSGSTGVPKGVVVCHRSVIDFINVFTEEFGIDETDVLGNQAPWDFDVSVKDIYSGLRTGACVQIIPREYFSVPASLLDFLDDRKVTNLTWAVSALAIVSVMSGFSYKVPGSIRRIMFSGETMPVRHLNYWRETYPQAQFVNLYGPTEITCNCTFYKIEKAFEPGDAIPIGKPFANETVFLLDEENHQVVTPGVQGEICVAGTALALGYYRNPEQTAKAFVQNPLNDAWPELIYRTGDLAFYNEDGDLVFASRKDFQIKHMGHRIELGEVECGLEKVEELRRCCCVFDEKRGRIVCFYQGEIGKRELAAKALEYLPDFMVPNVFRQLEEMPLTKNGKIDRRLLKEQLETRRKA